MTPDPSLPLRPEGEDVSMSTTPASMRTWPKAACAARYTSGPVEFAWLPALHRGSCELVAPQEGDLS